MVARRVRAIHVHENVADHDGRQLVLVPFVLELEEELLVVGGDNFGGHRPQVAGDRLRQARVQLVAKPGHTGVMGRA